MEKIKKTITAYVPGTACNFNCDYCYVGQCVDDKHFVPAQFNYDIKQMIEGFNPKRLGGIADIVVIGGGETLIPKEIVPFVKGLLEQGHFVEVVTNLTLNDRIDELLDIAPEFIGRLLVKGSFHYLELKRLNKLDDFFNNANKIINAGASFYPFMVIGDSYVSYLDDIRKLFLDRLGALPHVSPALHYEEKHDLKRGGLIKCTPELTDEFRKKIKNLFESEVFELCSDFIDVNPKETFCYAGKWSFVVILKNGKIMKCHGTPAESNMFETSDELIDLDPIGKNCGISTCALQYNFIAQGMLDGYNDTLNYSDLLVNNGGREKLFTSEAKELLKFKFTDFENLYNKKEQDNINNKTKILFENLRIREN